MREKQKSDLRFQKTEEALAQAFTQLLHTTPLDKITVSDICEIAKIRRATFYTHYKDKTDFVEHCMQKKQAAYRERWRGEGEFDPVAQCTEVLFDMLCYLQDNRALLDHVLNHLETPDIMQMFTNQIHRVLEESSTTLAQEGRQLIVPPGVLSSFYTGALVGAGRWWFLHQEDMTKDEMIKHLHRLLLACLPHMVEEEEGSYE